MTAPSPFGIACAAGLRPSTAQAAVLKSFAGESLSGDELRAFRKMTLSFLSNPRKGGYSELFVEAGRRSGKDSYLAAPCAVSALLSDTSSLNLAPGETAKVVVLGPKLESCNQCLDAIAGILDALHVPNSYTSLHIELPGRRTEVIAMAADHRVRGSTALLVIVTEGCFLPLEEGADGYDVEVYAAARPMLATTGGKLISISSPWLRAGVHYEAVRKYLGKTRESTLAVHAETWIMNPSVSEKMTHSLERDPRRRAREYGAQASESDDTFLRPTEVKSCVDIDVEERPPQPELAYVIGFDLGLRRDRSAIVVAHRAFEKRTNAPPLDLVVVDAIRVFQPEPPNRLDFDVIVTSLANISHRYRNAKVLRDSFSGDAVASALTARGVVSEELPMSSPAQAARFELLAQKVRSGSLRLLDGRDGKILVKELIDLRLKLHASGRQTIAAPERRGAHDDCADALSLAVEGAKTLTAVGGDVQCRFNVTREDSHVEVEAQWVERKIVQGTEFWVPTGPPKGSAAWYQIREEQRALGITVLDDVEEFEAARKVNVRVEGG
jgi:hypothetical protein